MLRSLHIGHYVLIDSLDIDFPEGLLIITGQTGAGKSIILGALSLVTGAKADPSVISPGADNCVVEAEFDVPAEVRGLMDDEDIEWDGNILTLRRVIYSSGRSRCFINDSPVTAQTLSETGSRLLDIHSQNQSLILKDRRWQMSVLDHYAGNGNLLAGCASVWKRLQECRSAIASKQAELERLSSEYEYNSGRYARLESAGLRDGELEELEEEHRSLSHAEEIKTAFSSVLTLVNSDENDLCGHLQQASRQLDRISSYIPSLASLSGRMDSARIELEDIVDDIRRADDRITLSEDRLNEVEQRLSTLYSLLKNYHCDDIASLIACRDELAAAVGGTSSLKEEIESLRAAEKELAAAHSSVCEQLRSARTAAAAKLAGDIQKDLRFLELDRAVFDVGLSVASPSATGADEVTFLFSSNGTKAEDVAKCASGGEVSRIMLCLKAALARFAKMPTMIFDEIDTGVSGSAADRMGTMICRMGESMQLLAITHLPQVAAKGRAHYVVSKSEDGSGTLKSTICPVSGEERVKEIARLLSGANISEAALANARELMSE